MDGSEKSNKNYLDWKWKYSIYLGVKKEGKGVTQSQILSTSKTQWLYAKGRCVHLPGEVFYQWR